MAGKLSETLVVPATLFGETLPSGFGMDVGGSLIKVAYAVQKDDKVHIHFSAYVKEELEEALKSLKTTLSGLTKPGAEVYTTGMGCNKFSQVINEALDIKIKNLMEMDCISGALKLFRETLPLSDSVFSPSGRSHGYIKAEIAALHRLKVCMSEDDSSGSFDSWTDSPDSVLPAPVPSPTAANNNNNNSGTSKKSPQLEFPAVVCCVGSGQVFVSLNEDSSYNFIGVSSLGGRMLMGLGSLLTGAKTFSELLSLAEKGDAGEVEIRCKDQKNADVTDIYSTLPDDKPMYCFGKAVGKDLNDFRKEDLAAALVSQMTQSIAQCCHQAFMSSDARTLLFAGSVCAESEFIRDQITKHFALMLYSKPKPGSSSYYFLKHGTYLGALGALLHRPKSS